MTGLILAVQQAQLEPLLLGPIGFAIAFLVGTVGFFSPCCLPLLPGYLSFVSGVSGEATGVQAPRRRLVLAISLFIAGFAVMFSLLGAAASALGGALVRNQPVLNRVAGAIVIVLGLAFAAPRIMPFLERERRPFFSRVKPGLAGAFPLGLAFAAGWTPCVGPGLGVMLTLGAAQGGAWRAAFLLFFFSLGFGVWFLLAGLGFRRALATGGLIHRHMRSIQATGGVFMIAIGVLLVTDKWIEIMGPLIRWANRFVPAI